jgi:hypothetical protein
MFWTFKLSFNVDILTYFGHFVQTLGEILINFLVTLAKNLIEMPRIFNKRFKSIFVVKTVHTGINLPNSGPDVSIEMP